MTGAKIGEFISDDTETAQLAKALSLVLAVHWAMTPERRAVWLADLQSSLAAQLGSRARGPAAVSAEATRMHDRPTVRGQV